MIVFFGNLGGNKLHIGIIRHNIDVSNEYEVLAKQDEEVALLLKKHHQYRHSIYFYIQAMEKYIRAKIFTLVNPNLDYFRTINQNHSLHSAIEFLIEIISTDKNTRDHIKEQLYYHVFENINFHQLHNNLRYPFYGEKYNAYSILEFNEKDCIIIESKLNSLKKYLQDLRRL